MVSATAKRESAFVQRCSQVMHVKNSTVLDFWRLASIAMDTERANMGNAFAQLDGVPILVLLACWCQSTAHSKSALYPVGTMAVVLMENVFVSKDGLGQTAGIQNVQLTVVAMVNVALCRPTVLVNAHVTMVGLVLLATA